MPARSRESGRRISASNDDSAGHPLVRATHILVAAFPLEDLREHCEWLDQRGIAKIRRVAGDCVRDASVVDPDDNVTWCDVDGRG